jgi:hypothetical protein
MTSWGDLHEDLHIVILSLLGSGSSVGSHRLVCKDFERIVSVNITGLTFTGPQLLAIHGGLPGCCDRLVCLTLHQTDDCPPHTHVAHLAAVLQASHHLTGLRHLSLRDNVFCNEGAAALATALREAPPLSGLRYLDLTFNCIGDEGAAALATALRESPHLAHLQHPDLTDNCIGLVGATALVDALRAAPHLSGLQCLDLTGNDIGLKEAAALAVALRASPHLAHLRLEF